MSFMCTATWETWDPSQWVWHHQIPPVWVFIQLSSSNGSGVRAWPSLTFYAYTDTCRSRVQPRERPGTHPNESGTIKYPQFDYLHTSLAQTVQELEHDQVLTLYVCADTCTATWENWDPFQSIWHHQIPPFWVFICPCSSNGSGVKACPSARLG